MKKTIAILLAVLLTCSLLAFAGCGGKSEGDEKTTASDAAPVDNLDEATDTTAPALVVDTVATPPQEWEDGDVAVSYCTMNTAEGTMGYFIIVNDGDEEIGFELAVTPKNAAGEAVGDDDLIIYVYTIAPGMTKFRPLLLAEGRNIDVATIEFESTYKNAFGHDAEPFLTVEDAFLDDGSGEKGVVVNVTNDGDITVAAYVHVLFCNEDLNIVGRRGDYTYGDADNAYFAPGETKTVTLTFDRDFITYDVYIDAEYFG